MVYLYHRIYTADVEILGQFSEYQSLVCDSKYISIKIRILYIYVLFYSLFDKFNKIGSHIV